MTKRKGARSGGAGQMGLGSIVVLLLLIALAYLGSGGDLEQGASGATDTPRPVASGQWYQIYFTDPVCSAGGERSGGLDETIAADLLATAQNHVDVAAYDLETEPIVNALIALRQRGVTVRVVTDSDNADLSSINRLRRNGISVVEDDRSGLMHNKFIVIDGRYLWVGAMNFAPTDVYCHNNNVVRFDAPQLAANYAAEMSEMYDRRQFGPTSPDDTPAERLTIGGVAVENYFASEGEVAAVLGERVLAAEEEILFMAFSFTHEDIGEAMLARAEDGVTVRGVFETTGSDTPFSYYGAMRDAGLANLQVRQDGNNFLMHHKVIIVDRETTIFGSFNFSGNANDSNDENVVIVHDPTFTSYFVAEFNQVWSEAKQ